MSILEFKSYEDYEKARDLLIEIHQKHPPKPVAPSFVLVAGNIQSKLLKKQLELEGILFKEKQDVSSLGEEENYSTGEC